MNLLTGGNTGTMTLVLDANLNAEVSHKFRSLVFEALSHSPKILVLEASQLNYIDSVGLGLLNMARDEANKIGCVISLSNVNAPHARKVLELVRFDKIFGMEGFSHAAS